MRLISITAFFVLSACGGDDSSPSTCTPGATQACVCSDGSSGAETCDGTGRGFGACICDAGDSGTPDSRVPDGGAPDGSTSCPDPSACPTGCCSGTECMPGNTELACGMMGDTCAPCVDGNACTGGVCRAPSCEESCGGCCSSTGCETGTEGAACGTGGNACDVCIDGESCESGSCVCVPDCGARACGPDGCGGECGAGCTGGQVCNAEGTACDAPGCSTCADCGASEACLFGHCESPWDRNYRVTLIDGEFPPRNDEGGRWDILNADPDPTARVSVSGTQTRYACENGTLMPAWLEDIDVTLSADSVLEFALIDEDPGGAFGCDGFTNDSVCDFLEFEGPGVGGTELRQLICDGGYSANLDAICDPGYAISFTIEPL